MSKAAGKPLLTVTKANLTILLSRSHATHMTILVGKLISSRPEVAYRATAGLIQMSKQVSTDMGRGMCS